MFWTIELLECKPTDGDLINVVITVYWRCTGQQGGFTESVYGSCSLGAPSEPFVPYDDLTLEQTLEWVWAVVDKTATEGLVAAAIDRHIHPTVVRYPLPWAV